MIQKKVCMIGAFAVGKTSLIRRYVSSIFSEKYHTTVGVKIDKKIVQDNDQEVMLMLWDLAGEDEFCEIRPSYVRGAAGYILVCDGTRPTSYRDAVCLHDKVNDMLGDKPFIMALNKSDLTDQWKLSDEETRALTERGWEVIQTSAKTGAGVEEAFQRLARQMIEQEVS